MRLFFPSLSQEKTMKLPVAIEVEVLEPHTLYDSTLAVHYKFDICVILSHGV